jgi:hypothetical protein
MIGPSPNWGKGYTVHWEDGGRSGILDFAEHSTVQFQNTNNVEKWFFSRYGSNATLIRFENHAQDFVPNYDSMAQTILDNLKKALYNHCSEKKATYSEAQNTGDYSFVNDANQKVIGMWFRDPEKATPEMVATALNWKGIAKSAEELAEITQMCRKAQNNFDNAGGYFVMFGSMLAPGEKAVLQESKIPTSHQYSISMASINLKIKFRNQNLAKKVHL